MLFELRIRFRRKVMFSKVGTLEQCTQWIHHWTAVSTCYDFEYTYTLYPKNSGTLQD